MKTKIQTCLFFLLSLLIQTSELQPKTVHLQKITTHAINTEPSHVQNCKHLTNRKGNTQPNILAMQPMNREYRERLFFFYSLPKRNTSEQERKASVKKLIPVTMECWLIQDISIHCWKLCMECQMVHRSYDSATGIALTSLCCMPQRRSPHTLQPKTNLCWAGEEGSNRQKCERSYTQ